MNTSEIKYGKIQQMIFDQPQKNIVLQSTNGSYISYGELQSLIFKTKKKFAVECFSRQLRIALIIKTPAISAIAFSTISCFATVMPINSSLTEEELIFFIEDLEADFILIEKGLLIKKNKLKRKYSNKIFEAFFSSSEISSFQITGSNNKQFSFRKKIKEEVKESEIALLLSTSGTTAKPKTVPLTQKNICCSAINISKSLNLKEGDRCLNIMPLFHIHGLLAGLLTSFSVGATVIVTDGFSALNFFEILKRFKPTWYTAVPTMHKMILKRIKKTKTNIQNNCLKFIRSSSAPLDEKTIKEIEAVFKVPVIEAYGMTEATHQITTNTNKPNGKKIGSVGKVNIPSVRIINNTGNVLPKNKIGEIVIKGDTITNGYLNNEKANSDSFYENWFRTGDLGLIDSDDFLWIKGRIKELINRGGEKISPFEVDNVISSHPEVDYVVTFALPHQLLFEEVAVAVVVDKGSILTEGDLINFCKEKLSKHKIPTKVYFLDELPKSSTGKLVRKELPKILNLT